MEQWAWPRAAAARRGSQEGSRLLLLLAYVAVVVGEEPPPPPRMAHSTLLGISQSAIPSIWPGAQPGAMRTAMEKLRFVSLGFGTARQKMQDKSQTFAAYGCM
jgi:hypothetical protein